MTVKTAEKHLKELAAKAEIFEKAVNGYDGGKLLYTVNCICATYDGGIITITTPLNWQKCFYDFRQGFEAFSSMVKKVVSDDKSSKRVFTPFKEMGGLSEYGYLFYSSEEEMEQNSREALDNMFAEKKSSLSEYTIGLCEYGTQSSASLTRNIVNLTVSLVCPHDEEDTIISLTDEMAKKNYNCPDADAAAERRAMLARLSRDAESFKNAVKPFGGKGLRYVLTSASAAWRSPDTINLVSVPRYQMAFDDFKCAYLLFFSHIIANLSAIDAIKISRSKTDCAPDTPRDTAGIKITSVFENPEESASSVYTDVEEGKSVCLCSYHADNIEPSSRAYVGLFACMPER